MSKQGQGILVAGMHRSGTSALAGALSRLGVALGDALVPAAEDNPKGYFEHAAVVAIHEQLFHELGRWWYDPRPLPAGWLETPAARRAGDALARQLRNDFSAHGLWAVKDPRLCRFIPLWQRVLARIEMPAKVLVVMRDPAEVCASLTARNGFGAELGELLWLRHVVDAVRDSDGFGRTVILYDDLVRTPEATLGSALERLGLQAPVAETQRAEALHGFVDPAFQHHAGSPPADATPQAGLANRFFALGRAISRGEGSWDGFSPLLAEFDRHWQTLSPYLQAMGDAVFPDLEAKARLATEIHAAKADLNAQVRWGKETLAQHEALRESMTREREQLAADLAHARSDLIAQVRWAEAMLEQHREVLAESHRQASSDRERIAHLEARLDAAQARHDALRDRLDAVRASFSWRITAPLRALGRAFRGSGGDAPTPADTPPERDK